MSKGEIELPHQVSQEELATHEYEQQEQAQEYRIYRVTDALKSKYTKRDYGYAFAQFLKDGAKTQDLQVLLDYKPKVIEQMVIGYIEMLAEKGRAHKTIQLHNAAILHSLHSMTYLSTSER